MLLNIIMLSHLYYIATPSKTGLT